jgi:hypothetical protein
MEVLPLSLPSGFIFLRRLYGVKRRTGPEAAEKNKIKINYPATIVSQS